jgi:hypothetical protein
MMFTIVFGLSMDYEVFLLSRMREEWVRSGDNSQAVTSGLTTTARVITAAAAIVVCVFGSFVIGDPLRILGVFGLGLAVAVLVDATVVRMVLVPAVMQLLGPANWWLPGWIGRATPTSPSNRAWITLRAGPGLHPAGQRTGRRVIPAIPAAGVVAAVGSRSGDRKRCDQGARWQHRRCAAEAIC